VLSNNKFIKTFADFLGSWKIPNQIGAFDPSNVLLAGLEVKISAESKSNLIIGKKMLPINFSEVVRTNS